MTDFNIEIIQQPSYSLEVAVGASGTDVPSIEIVTSGGIYLEISNRDRILASDLPDTYPISSTTGLLPISRVSGLYAGSGIIFSSGIDGSITIQGQTQNINITGTSGISVIQSGSSYIIYTTGNFGLTSSQIQSLLNNGVSISITGGTGNFNSLSVNSVPVSTSGHSHLSSSITDFNSSVSALIPVKNIVNSGYVVVSSSSGIFTIGVTGLQPSGNYSLSGHNHTVSNITDFNSATSGLLTPYALLNSGNFITLLVSSIPVSLSGHTHTSSQITDFNSSVSGLLPFTGILGSGYVTLSSLNRTLTIGVSGLQPSGNYSISGHQHVVADITNFNSGVSGLLPSISGGNYISILPSGNSYILSATGLQPSGNYSVSGHTHISSQITDFNSSVSSLIPVKNIVGSGYINVISTTGLFSVSVTGLQPVGNYSLSGHTHIASNITDFNSATSGLLTPYAQLDDAVFNNLAVDTLFTSNAPNFVVDEDGNTGIGGGNELVAVIAPNVIAQYSISAASGTISSGLNVFNYLRLNNTGVSLSGHSHTVSDISNFGSGVSGLLPVRNIVAGTGIAISNIGGVFTINSSGSAGGGSSNVAISNSGVGRLLASDGTSSGIIGQSGLIFSNNTLFVTGVPVSISGHAHTLTIGSGSGTAITYDSSQALNILGSGNTTISYDNSNKTVYINSPFATRGYEILGSGKSVFSVDGGYVVGNIDVFYNGVKLLDGNDFSATNGTTFTLAYSGIAGDVIEWASLSTAPRYQIIMGEVRSDFVSGINYIGNAIQGSSESSEVWRIKKTTIDSNGSIVSNLTANNVRWTDRLTASYV